MLIEVIDGHTVGAESIVAAQPTNQRAGGGAEPTPALHSVQVLPIPIRIAKSLLVHHHYLHSLPGGTQLAFGVFLGHRLLGALTMGAGPTNAYGLVDGAVPEDCATLSRLWLSNELPGNSESKVLGVVLRALKKHTELKFLVTYVDPAQGHVGTIYQATGWLYTGLSQAMPLYDIGDGNPRHSRSLSHAYGSRSAEYFARHGIQVIKVPQMAKHRYIRFLSHSWQDRLRVPVLPYPKLEAADESD